MSLGNVLLLHSSLSCVLMSRVMRVFEMFTARAESFEPALNVKGPRVGEVSPEKYHALFSEGALTAAP